MDQETKDTLLKVAEYATEGHKKSHTKVLCLALGICVTLIICTILFAGEHTGLLYGIVPESVCNMIFGGVYLFSGVLLVAYLRVLPFREKPTQEPVRATQATVTSKEVRSGTHGTGRSQMGYSFVVTFRTEDGQTLELFAYEEEFGGLKEGMAGMLTYQGRYFMDFE